MELVSGAREGNIFLWDTRYHGNGPRFECQVVLLFRWFFQEGFLFFIMILASLQPVQRILSAHVKEASSSKNSASGNQQSKRRMEQNHHSVTSVVFLDDTVLASSGANDGTVKLWDLRKTFFHV